ncbi:MAG: hypothetical protein DRJ52_07980 [Thermoprotei archaeon]|nr:MAG: hypothetical protein DRJ52_07980 [Thermoprotei archaeon]
MSEDIISYIEKRLKEKGKIKEEKPKEEKKEKKKEKRKKEKKRVEKKPRLKLKIPKIKIPVSKPEIKAKRRYIPQTPPVKYLFLERNNYGSLAIDEEKPVLYVWLSAKDDEIYRKWKFLAPLVACQDIYEIFVKDDKIAVSHSKFAQRLTVSYVNARIGEPDVLRLIMNIAVLSGARLSLESPMVYTSMDNWRIVLYGLASFAEPSMTLTRVLRVPSLTEIVDPLLASRLLLVLLARFPTVIAGAPGVGKTTLMNAIINEVVRLYGNLLRIYVVEQVAELQLPDSPLVTRIVTGPEGASELTLVKAVGEGVQRGRPDILVLGELHYSDIPVWINALAAGSCCITTFHAEDFEQCVSKIYSQMKVNKVIEELSEVFNYVKVFVLMKAARTQKGIVRYIEGVHVAVNPNKVIKIYDKGKHLPDNEFLSLVDSTIVNTNVEEEYSKLKGYFKVCEVHYASIPVKPGI